MEGKWHLAAFLAAALLAHTCGAATRAIPFYCKLNEFQCPSKINQCIMRFQLCNGIKNCADGSDENPEFCKAYGCNYTSPSTETARLYNWKCPSGNMCTRTFVYYAGAWLCTGGKKDCADGSDEDPRYCKTLARNCSLNAQGVFDETLDSGADTCPSKKYCVDKGKLCDGKKDCPDGSDEWPSFCKNFTCLNQDIFRCKDWGCLEGPESLCNGVKDCGDGSDEDAAFCATYKCPFTTGKKCPDGRTCLGDWQICDGTKTCPDGSDEKPSFCRSFKCPGLKYKCKDGKQCGGYVSYDASCSTSAQDYGTPLCKDKSDADNAFCAFPSKRNCNDTEKNFRCRGGGGCIDKNFLCDGEKHCKDGSDEGEFCKTYDCRYSSSGVDQIVCKDSLKCTSGSLCDGYKDCRDGSDEDPTFCRAYKCPEGSRKCKNFRYQCVNDLALCDGKRDCINGGDEDPKFCRSFKCLGEFQQKCPNYPSQCIEDFRLCDGKKDCINGGDEDPNFCKAFNCSVFTTKCPKDPSRCADSTFFCDGEEDKDCLGDEDPTFCKTFIECLSDEIKCPNSSTYQCVAKVSLCNGKNDCTDGSDEDPALCKNVTCPAGERKCPNSKSNKCISELAVCTGRNECGDGSYEDPAFCRSYKCLPGYLKCPNSTTHKCISQYYLCDGYDHCSDGSDEDPTFCKSYTCPPSYQKCPNYLSRCIEQDNLCDGSPRCLYGSDEDPAFCRTHVCLAGKWKCPKSGLCIPRDYLCNGVKDCYDLEDEDPEICNDPKFKRTLGIFTEEPGNFTLAPAAAPVAF
eukprot:TRINITY_DN6462_c0_g4_i1.p1 TRINITY_DN6462_c0_g4~~TRINITY_DN6462_c0_g4_i1.p1  ORF type:complete len:792 (+),score=118.53 TRINITY_DN6462_c0_g4_i1:209-2584(+)